MKGLKTVLIFWFLWFSSDGYPQVPDSEYPNSMFNPKEVKNDTGLRLTAENASEEGLSWVDLQWPGSASIAEGGSVDIYAQCYKQGVKPQVPEQVFSAFVGYNTVNSNPNTWTIWIPASFANQYGTNDEYKIALGNGLAPGIYYYASRFQYNGGTYQYGGFNINGCNAWDGIHFVSGVLAVGKKLATVSISNLLQQYDGTAKGVNCITNPAGLPLYITYNGSANKPVNPGNYNVVATINDLNYQGSQTSKLSIWTISTDSIATSLRKKFIWVMYDQVRNQTDLDMALSYTPDVIERAWFKSCYSRLCWKCSPSNYF